MRKQVHRSIEVRDGVSISIVRMSSAFAETLVFGQHLYNDYFDYTTASEWWIDDLLYASNVDTFRERKFEQENLSVRLSGTKKSFAEDPESSTKQIEFRALWRECLSLFAYASIGDSVRILKDREVLNERIQILSRLLKNVENERWATWERLNVITVDDDLIAVDMAFDRFLSSSSSSLPIGKRREVERLWRDVSPIRREFVCGLKAKLPSEIKWKFTTSDIRERQSLSEADLRFYFSQSLTEYARYRMGTLDPALGGFAWNTEASHLLSKLRYHLEAADRDFDVEKVLAIVVLEAVEKGRELSLAMREIQSIFTPRAERDDFKNRMRAKDVSSMFTVRGLIWDMLCEHAPELLSLVKLP